MRNEPPAEFYFRKPFLRGQRVARRGHRVKLTWALILVMAGAIAALLGIPLALLIIGRGF
jgi:hypothetical protein